MSVKLESFLKSQISSATRKTPEILLDEVSLKNSNSNKSSQDIYKSQ